MFQDSFFKIGSEHNICQDYALTNKDNLGNYYGIISDGCSSVNRSEYGAQTLTLLAEKTYLSLNKDISLEHFYNSFQDKLLKNMQIYKDNNIKFLNINDDFMSASLGLITAKNNIAHSMLFGDGNIIVEFQDNSYSIVRVEYEDNTPFYLEYYSNKNYLERAKNKELNNKTVTYLNFKKIDDAFILDSKYTQTVDIMSPIMFAFTSNFLKKIAITSDGLQTFNITDEEILFNLFQYKNTAPNFAQRRYNMYMKEKTIKHEDDISIAVFAFE
jgi:hypothetical protein